MKKFFATAAVLVALATPALANTDHKVVDHYYTISVPNEPDGSLGTLNYRTEPRGKIVGHFDVKAPKLDDGSDNGLTSLWVTQKKGKWWYVEIFECGDSNKVGGWVNSKYLVAHPIYSDDGCMC
jgi:hypothetical protein